MVKQYTEILLKTKSIVTLSGSQMLVEHARWCELSSEKRSSIISLQIADILLSNVMKFINYKCVHLRFEILFLATRCWCLWKPISAKNIALVNHNYDIRSHNHDIKSNFCHNYDFVYVGIMANLNFYFLFHNYDLVCCHKLFFKIINNDYWWLKYILQENTI